MRQHTIALTERERLLGEGCNAANRTKAAGLRICHLIDEDWIHPECITRRGPLQSRSGLEGVPLRTGPFGWWKSGRSAPTLMEAYSVSFVPTMYRPSSPRHFRSFTSPSSVSTPSLTSAPRRSGNGSSSRMTQHERQEKSDQQENGDDWRGVGNSSRGVPDPFRGQKTDQQWAIHRRTLSHRESLTFTSVPRKIICSLYAPGRTMAATLFGPILGALVTCISS